jgi:hypothetical protein
MPDTGQSKSADIKQIVLNQAGWFTRKDIEDALPDCSGIYIKKTLREMVEAGMLEAEGKTRNAKYCVKN